MKTFWNVMGCIFASLFSIVLVLVLLVFPIYQSVASLASAKTLTNIVQNIDYTAFLPSGEDLKTLMGDEWANIPIVGDLVDADELDNVVDGLIKSKAMGRVLELYTGDVINAVMQTGEEQQLTADALQDIIIDETDSLVDIILPYIPEESAMSKAELVEELQNTAAQSADEIFAFLPSVEDLIGLKTEDNPDDVIGELEDGVYAYRPEDAHASPTLNANDPFAILRQLLSPAVATAFIIAIVVLVALIALCRFNRFGGLLWLGIDTLVASFPILLLALGAKGLAAAALTGEGMSSIAPIITSATAVFSRKLMIAAVLYIVIGIVAIVCYALLYKRAKNKQATPETPPEEIVFVQE